VQNGRYTACRLCNVSNWEVWRICYASDGTKFS